MLVIPAILSKDPAEIRRQVRLWGEVAPWLQADILDGSAYEAETVSPDLLPEEMFSFRVEMHLMVAEPQRYFAFCAEKGVERVYIQLEPVEEIERVLRAAAEFPFQTGLAIAPETSVESVRNRLEHLAAVLVMTVRPGAQGGEFLPGMLEKVRRLRRLRPDLWLAVDGGINEETASAAASAGADAAGVGSALARARTPEEARLLYRRLTKKAAGV